MSKLTCHYPLNSCTFLTSGYVIARQKHRFFEPKKPSCRPAIPKCTHPSSITHQPSYIILQPSSSFSPRGDREGVIIFPLGGMRGVSCFLCFCFHKIGSKGATALVTRLSVRLRTSRIVANGVQVSVQETLSYEGVIIVFVNWNFSPSTFDLRPSTSSIFHFSLHTFRF